MYGMLVYNRTMGKIKKEGTGSKKSYFCEGGSWKGSLRRWHLSKDLKAVKEVSIRHLGKRAKIGVEGAPGASQEHKEWCWLGLNEQEEEMRLRYGVWVVGLVGKPLESSRELHWIVYWKQTEKRQNGWRQNQLLDFLDNRWEMRWVRLGRLP